MRTLDRSESEERRPRIGEGANLVVGGLKVQTVCVRLIRAAGLMSRLQAREYVY